MAGCCRIDNRLDQPCPGCGRSGVTVGAAPVRAHLPGAAEGPWQHCANPACPVVFHLDGDTVTEDEVTARVGAKALEQPEPVCFCFAHTAPAITADVAEHGGASTIKASIRQAVADGACACEHLNPSGSCCLGAVNRVIKAAAAQAPVSANLSG